MQQHVQIGYDLVKGIPFLADAAELILRHHERCDGSGYPHGLAGCDIPVPAKIFAVADSFDAMTSDRPYRSALPVSVARKEISEKSATLFDAHVVAAFLTIPADAWPSIREQAGTIAIASVLSPSSLNSFLELGCETQHPIEPQPDGGRSCHSEPHREETACPQNRA